MLITETVAIKIARAIRVTSITKTIWWSIAITLIWVGTLLWTSAVTGRTIINRFANTVAVSIATLTDAVDNTTA